MSENILRIEARLRERANELRWSRPVRRREATLPTTLDGWPVPEGEHPDGSRGEPLQDVATHGACIDCGREISVERLRAVPHAARCMGCQRSVEGR